MLGFSPQDLRRARPGYAWLLADVPETIIENLEKEDKVSVAFSSYPAETFQGQISAIGDVVDNNTRTVKVRITLPNKDGKIKPGMYAKVNISLQVNNTLSVPASALVAVQARNYVFVKKGNSYRRTEVVTGQQIGNNVLVLKGLQESDSVLYQGTMLMKGISFGF
jgi:cobalt-zinc-cadmium efflux system membrane fusion protein